MPELEHTPIRQETYDVLKQGVKNWIEQDLKWKREDIMSVCLENEVLYNVGVEEVNGVQWTKHKLGKHVDITLTSMSQEKQSQRFIRLDNGDWEKKRSKLMSLIQFQLILVAGYLVFFADNAISATRNRDFARMIFYGIVAILALIYVVLALIPH